MSVETRAAARLEELVLALFPDAETGAGTLLVDGQFTAHLTGVRRGHVMMDGQCKDVVDLVAHKYQCTREEALDSVGEWFESGPPRDAAEGAAEQEKSAAHGIERDTIASVTEAEKASVSDSAAVGQPVTKSVTTAAVAIRQPAHYRPDVHNFLPQSPDAEKGVLSSFMIAPVEVGKFCAEKGLRPAHFHSPAHAEIFEAMAYFHGERMDFDFITLTEYLHTAKRLEHVGGAAFVTDLFTFLPTATNLAYYVEIVQEKYELRSLIAACTEISARCYDEQDQLPLLLAEAESRISQIAAHRLHASLAETRAACRFDAATPPPEPVPVFLLNGAIIATPGNLMNLQGKAKTGKTAVLSGMIASTMEPRGDCLGFASANPLGRALIHFDTEQSPWDHHQCMLRALHRAGRRDAPKWLRSYGVAGLPLAQRVAMLRAELERATTECGGVLAVILDGIADFIIDPNDPAEAFPWVDELHQLAIKYHTVIVCVLHENPGTEIGKTRGHLGSHLERKAETNLRLEKDGEGVTVMFTERARHTHIAKDKGARFEWSDEAKMHVSTEAKFQTAGRGGRQPGEPKVNAALVHAKAEMGQVFAARGYRRAELLMILTQSPANSRVRMALGTFNKYWGLLRAHRLIVPDKAVPSIMVACEEWNRDLQAEYDEP